MRYLISGGGSGGHIIPALAIAEELKKKDNNAEIWFVGTKDGMEAKIISQNKYHFEAMAVKGFKREVSPQPVIAFILFLKALWESRRILNTFRPDIVIGTGGYVSGPIVYSAAKKGYPCLIQEQNSYPGLTTRWLAKYVDEIHTSYEKCTDYLSKYVRKITVSGNPLRIQPGKYSREDCLSYFGLSNEYKTLLILGGSQGAESINNTVLECVNEFSKLSMQIIWQTGRKHYKKINNLMGNTYPSIVVKEFIDDMNYAYTASDFVLCRAGAMSLSEIALFALPVILIPYPHATADHQRKNAEEYKALGAARILLEQELTKDRLVQEVNQLLNDTTLLQTMSRASLKLAKPQAAQHIAGNIMTLITKYTRSHAKA